MKKITKKLMKKIIFYSILGLSISGAISCLPKKDNNQHQRLNNAEPIVLELEEKINTDNAFAFDLFKATYKLTDESNLLDRKSVV